MERCQTEQIVRDLSVKMIFIVGPRQVGKTWLGTHIGKAFPDAVYLNYDNMRDAEMIRNHLWLPDAPLIIFDEIHKMKGWKTHLKGIFDTKPDAQKILVTGSARLDTFRRSGDSLAGRFFVHRLLPFSLAELAGTPYEHQLDRLLLRGGFPEPFLAEDDTMATRWRSQYLDGLIRQDVLSFERIHDLRTMELLVRMLRDRLGSPVSYSSLARDLEVSPSTIKKFVEILEALFIVFRVTPYSRNIARSLLKEPKIYFYDNGLVNGEGAKLENLAAVSFLKYIWMQEDTSGVPHALQYLRTKDGREVDFCLVRDGIMHTMVEIKSSDSSPSKHLKYFSERHNATAIQLVRHLRNEQVDGKVEIRKFGKYFHHLSGSPIS